MSAKFTPGPWRETKGDGGIYGGSRPYRIAQVGIGGKSSDEYIANINLITAAPDLYKALQYALRELIACKDLGMSLNKSIELASAALAKAALNTPAVRGGAK